MHLNFPVKVESLMVPLLSRKKNVTSRCEILAAVCNIHMVVVKHSLFRQNKNVIDNIFVVAYRTLMSTLSDFEFEAPQFLEYLQPTFSSLFILLKEAKECDTKVFIFITILSLFYF